MPLKEALRTHTSPRTFNTSSVEHQDNQQNNIVTVIERKSTRLQKESSMFPTINSSSAQALAGRMKTERISRDTGPRLMTICFANRDQTCCTNAAHDIAPGQYRERRECQHPLMQASCPKSHGSSSCKTPVALKLNTHTVLWPLCCGAAACTAYPWMMPRCRAPALFLWRTQKAGSFLFLFLF